MGAGEITTDGVAGADGWEGDGTGVEGRTGVARVDALSSSVLERVVRGGGASAGVPALLAALLVLVLVEGPATG
jgi:hypothetical protein